MTLLVSRVFGNEVKVLAANDKGSVHLGRDDCTSEDTAAYGYFAGKWAFLI